MSGFPGTVVAGKGYSRLSLRRRLALSFVLLALVTLATTAVAAVAYAREVQARHHVIGVVDQARLVAQTLQSDYVDEETSIRGYVLTRETDFLQPYDSALLNAPGVRRQLGRLVAGDAPSRGLIAPIDRATAAWRRQFALPALTATRAGSSAYSTTAAQALGKRDFDQIQAAFNSLDRSLQQSAASGMATLNESQATFEVLAGVLIAILLLAGLAAWWALRSWVTRPLDGLREDVRQVAVGALDHQVEAVGPPDLADLAEGVEMMQLRIMNEVRLLRDTSALLEAANTDLARSNVELEQFAYVASHDLQEPLRKVVSFCELLSRRYANQLDERADEYIAFAVDGARRMQVLINDLLAFSRVGRTTQGFETVHLDESLASALVNLAAAIEEADAEIKAGRLPEVPGDASLLVMLLQNLIGNAIKFRGEAPPKIELSARREGAEWRFALRDNGIGIEPRFADRIFVIFQRLHGRELYEGTGIGLALCKKIVEFHGGRIWLDTEFSPGTRIYWTLPAVSQ